MKLLKEIIDLLMNESGSLNEALLKTKVLLHEIGQRELVGWVNSELAGYADNAEVPAYRVVESRIFGNITNGVYTYPQRPIPLSHIEREVGFSLDNAKMSQAIGVLEKYLHGSTEDSALARALGPHWDALFSKAFSNGYYVEGAYSHIPIGQVRQIVIEVRSRLLDFILGLRDEVGGGTSDDEVKEIANNLDVATMFHKAMFGGNANFGNNTTIIVGSHNHQQVTNTAVKNDRSALAAELRKHGVADEDIEALNTALDQDPVPEVPEQYGPAVQSWIVRMIGKAASAGWNVSIGAAGNVLGTVLQNYYGISAG